MRVAGAECSSAGALVAGSLDSSVPSRLQSPKCVPEAVASPEVDEQGNSL